VVSTLLRNSPDWTTAALMVGGRCFPFVCNELLPSDPWKVAAVIKSLLRNGNLAVAGQAMYDCDNGWYGGEYGMRIFGKSAAALAGVFVTVGASATIAVAQTPVGIAQAPGTETQQAQAEAVPGLNAAIAAGDVKALDAMVAANANNPAVQAQIAAAILAGAQAAKDSNPTLAGMMAAIAVASGGLVGNNAVTALNMVVSSPSTMALLTNPNAPAFTSNFFASLAVPNRPIGVANSGVIAAENSAQASGSNN
jgi:hypothetical protein